MAALALAAIGLAAVDVLVLAWVSVARVRFAREERRRRALERRLRPTALALVEGDSAPVPSTPEEAEALAALLGRYARQLRGDARIRIGDFFERSGAVERVVGTLGDRRGSTRAEAAFALGDMGSQAAVAPLLRALDDSDVDVRAAAARSLGRLGAAEAAAPLLELAAHGSLPGAVVGRSLLEIGPAALPSLRTLLEHEHPAARAAATELVGLLGGAGDAARLIERLDDRESAVRAQAATALGRLGAEEAERAVRSALDDPAEEVRAAAAETLGTIGSRADIPALARVARDDAFAPARAAARAIVRLGGDAAQAAAGGRHLAEALDLAALP